MLTTYRRVLGLPGALAFSLSGLVARLPISMVGLGIVLLVSTRTGSYSLAGAISASFVLANAVFAVVQGRLTDRVGQGRLLPVGVTVFAVALVLMMVAVELSWGGVAAGAFAALAGAAQPQVGSMVRARWSYVVPDRSMLQTAFAFEAVVDETVFMLGPTLVTLLATAVHPLAGLVAADLLEHADDADRLVVVALEYAAARRTRRPVLLHGREVLLGLDQAGILVASTTLQLVPAPSPKSHARKEE